MENFQKFIKQKEKITKISLILRCSIVMGVLGVFYLNYIWNSHQESSLYHELNEKYWISNPARRRILSIDMSGYEEPMSVKEDYMSADISSTYEEHMSAYAKLTSAYEEQTNCSKPAISEFPSDGFTRDERAQGWIVLHMIGVVYGFWFLAAVCDDYLVPSLEQICSNFHINRDVIGATVMAAAVSSPELFINCIGTFITKGDIGVSAIVGSAVFNVLAVPACCGLFLGHCIKLDWWPITRDSLVYLVVVLSLLAILQDGKVMWYEALALTSAYFIYMLVMYFNRRISRKARRWLQCWHTRPAPYHEVTEITSLLHGNNNSSKYSVANEAYVKLEQGLSSSHIRLYLEQQEREESISSPWSCREDYSWIKFIFRWPITFILWLTLPNCRRHHGGLKYLTLLLVIVWIGVVSYLVAFGVTIIGDTLYIPDTVMGLTIMACGMSIPEAVASVIVTKQGQPSMGLSNSLGSNTFNILLSLGLPWFIKSYFLPDEPQEHWIILNTNGLTYVSGLLLASLIGLYAVFALNRFNLNRKLGAWCLGMYVVFIIAAILVELNVFFEVNLPTCPH